MSAWLSDLMPVVLRASVFLAAGSFLAMLFSSGKRYPRLQRGVWFAVLLQGLIFIRFDLSTHWIPSAAHGVIEEVQLPEADIAADLGSLIGVEPTTSVQPVLAAPSETSNIDRMLFVAGIWLAGMAITFGSQLFAYVRFLKRVDYVETPANWERDWATACKESKLKKKTTVRATASVGPLVCRLPGEYRLLLPLSLWSELKEPQRATILRHEIAHIQRGDILKSAVMRLLALPHWFNPFAWLAVRRFEDCAEWACDDATQASMPDAMSDYATALLELGRSASPTPSPVSAANGRPLVERIQRVLNPTGKETRLMKTKALIAIAVVGALTAVNSVRIVQAAQEPTQSKPEPAPDFSKPNTHAVRTVAPPSNQTQVPNGIQVLGMVEEPGPIKVPAGSEVRVLDAIEQARGIIANSTKVRVFRMTETGEPTTIAVDVAEAQTASEANIRLRAGDTVVVEQDVLNLATRQPKQAEAVPREDEAVIDIARIFDEHPVFKRRRESLKANVRAADTKAKQLAGKPAEFEKFRNSAQKELMTEESKIYLEVFRSIQATVAKYARSEGIRLVRRVSTQPIEANKDADVKLTPNEVVALMNRPIVFVDNQPRDITDAVIRIIREQEVRSSLKNKRAGIPVLQDAPIIGPVFRASSPVVSPPVTIRSSGK